ncbi:MAG: nucleoside deaminase [Oscillospiraceae bacterium]|nr:nucleoside deaminase [Oscillospiraceae bacterium]
MNDHDILMQEALKLAREAGEEGEIPVGCIVLDPEGRIIGRGRNRRENSHDATAHAEMEAIRQACAERGDWRLSDCSIFVTLEPCPMCAGAILNARIPRVIFGAREANSGSCGSVIDLFSENYGQHPAVYAGVCADESRALLRDFFRKRDQKAAKNGA